MPTSLERDEIEYNSKPHLKVIVTDFLLLCTYYCVPYLTTNKERPLLSSLVFTTTVNFPCLSANENSRSTIMVRSTQ